MKNGKLMLLAGLAAILMAVGSWAPLAGEADASHAVVAQGDVQENAIPTILPPV